MEKIIEAICPHCKKTKLKSYLNNLTDGKPHHFWCRKCKEEFYTFACGGLMTHKEYIAAKNDFNG